VKFDVLRAVGHNIADSCGGGIGLLVGIYDFDVYGEACSRKDGRVTVDFLEGEAMNAVVSSSLANVIAKYRDGLQVDLS
jgi:hypothetical protein